MDPGPLRDVLTAIVGLATGALSGAFGVGGAVISTPGIRLLGVGPIVAVGTTIPSILPSAASGALHYRAAGLVDARTVLAAAPVGLLASILGAVLSEHVPGDGHLLMLATAALLGVTAWRMGRSARSDPVDERDPSAAHPTRRLALAAVGGGAGLLSGLLGIGGGVVLVPGFATYAGLSLKSAIATSLVCVAAFALPGTVSHAVLGNIDWRVALFLTLTVIPGARLGAALTMRASDRRLRQAVALLLGTIAVLYAAGELSSLAR